MTTRAKRHERGVVHVPGDPAMPFGEDGLKAKFLPVIAPALKNESARIRLRAALRGIDDPVGDAGEIDRLAFALTSGLEPVTRQHGVAAGADLVAVLAEAGQHIAHVGKRIAAEPDRVRHAGGLCRTPSP